MLAGIEQQNAPAWEALGNFYRPFLFLAGERDPNLGRAENQDKWIAHVPGAIGQDHRRYDAGHFIQEDVGAEMAAQVVEFIALSEPAPAVPSIHPLAFYTLVPGLMVGVGLVAMRRRRATTSATAL